MKNLQVKVRLGREEVARGGGFGLTLGDEVDVVPSRKEVEVIPLGATVAHKYEIRHGSSVSGALSPGRSRVTVDDLKRRVVVRGELTVRCA